MAPLLTGASRLTFRTVNRFVEPLVRSGITSPLPIGVGLVVVESAGRVSGLPRRVPLVAARIGDRVIVSTVRHGSQWVRNLEAHPTAGVWLAGRRRSARASVQHGIVDVVHLDIGGDVAEADERQPVRAA
jgi:hypothetical protein